MDMTINEKRLINQFGPFEKLKILVVTKVTIFYIISRFAPHVHHSQKLGQFFSIKSKFAFPKNQS